VILLYLDGRIRLAPTDENGRLWTHQIQLTITDNVQEVYNSHHPIDEDKWFHEQMDEAVARAAVSAGTGCRSFLAGSSGF
jgi:glutathione S-transferase